MLLYRTTWLNARWLVDNSGFRLHSKRTTVPAPLSVGLVGEWRQNGGICGHYHCVALALDLLVVYTGARPHVYCILHASGIHSECLLDLVTIEMGHSTDRSGKTVLFRSMLRYDATRCVCA